VTWNGESGTQCCRTCKASGAASHGPVCDDTNAASAAALSEEVMEDCSICCESSIARKDAAELPTKECKHWHSRRSVCITCLEKHVGAEVGKGLKNEQISCPQSGCKAAMKYCNVKQWAKASDFEKYDKQLLDAFNQQDESFRYCAWSGCESGQLHEQMDRAPIMTCIKCNRKTCFTHRCPWHENKTCEQYDQDVAKKEAGALNQALKGRMKLCPNCRQGIEKNNGCDHMTCRCGREFC